MHYKRWSDAGRGHEDVEWERCLILSRYPINRSGKLTFPQAIPESQAT
jgi:hypothetical protein